MSARTVKRVYRVGGERVEVEVHLKGDRLEGRVARGGSSEAVEAVAHRAGDQVVLRMDGAARWATVLRQGNSVHVAIDGHVHVLAVESGAGDRGGRAAAEEPHALSPMTGTVAKVSATPGAAVTRGAPLFVVEAMKMEFVVKAPRDVVVAEVRRKAGDKVALGEVVVTFREEA